MYCLNLYVIKLFSLNNSGVCGAACENTIDGTATLEEDYGEVCKNDGTCQLVYGTKPSGDSRALANLAVLFGLLTILM